MDKKHTNQWKKAGFVLVLGLLFLAILPSAEALIKTKNYDPITETITISDWAGLDKLVEFQLIENTDHCFENCHAIIKVTPDNDIDSVERYEWNFYNRRNKLSEDIKEWNLYRQNDLDYYENVTKYIDCNITGTKTNNQTGENESYTYISKCENGTELVKRETKIWEDYDFGINTLRSGKPFLIKLEGKKDIYSSVDWIPTFFGFDFDEWAWWNSSYDYRRDILNETTSDIAVAVNGTSGFLGKTIWVNPSQLDNISIYYKNASIYAVANDTEEANYETEGGGLNNSITSIYNSNAMAVYHFGTDGSAEDSTSNLNHQTNDGAEWTSSGIFGGAYDFELDNTDSMLAPASDELKFGTGDFSACMNIKLESRSIYGTIVNWNGYSSTIDGWFIRVHNNNSVEFSTRDNAYVQVYTPVLSADTWYFVCGIRDGTNHTIWLDNTHYSKSGTAYDVTGEEDNGLTIGKTIPSSSYFDGLIDEVRIYNRALTETEIQELYNNSQNLNMQLGDEETVSNISINLISPADNYTSSSGNITFQCSANSTGGAEFGNATLDIWNSTDNNIYSNTLNESQVSCGNGEEFCPSEMISYWKLEEGNGTFFVDTIGTNNGTCVGDECPTYTMNGKIGGAYNFDGVDDSIILGSSNSIITDENNFTIAIWVKINGNSNTSRDYFSFLKGVSSAFMTMRVDINGYADMIYRDTTGSANTLNGATIITDNIWHQIIFTRSGAVVTSYVDSNQDVTVSNAGGAPSTDIAHLGRTGSGVFYANGTIDEVVVYNKALNQTEINELYQRNLENRGYCPTSDSCTAEWNVTNLDDDNYKWGCSAFSYDGLYNDTTDNRSFSVDATDPIVDIQSPVQDQLYYQDNLPIEIDLNYTATDTNRDSCWYHTSWNSTNITLPDCNNTKINLTEIGSQSVTVYANDTVGRLGSDTNTFTVAKNLTVIQDSPADSYISPIENVSFVCNASIEGTNLTNLTLRVYNSTALYYENTLALTGSSDSKQWDLTNIPDDDYNWNCLVQANPSKQTGNRTFTVDTITPDIDFITPTTESGYHSQNYIEANVTSTEPNPDTLTINLYNSTGLYDSNVSTNVSQQFYNFTSVPDGIYYLNATINDTIGHENFTETRTIILDTTNPSIAFDIGTEANNTSFNKNWIYANWTLTETNFKNITARIYNSTDDLINKTTFIVPTYEINWTLTDLNEQYHYNIEAYDLANNNNITETRYLTLDNTNPIINITHPTEYQGFNDESLPKTIDLNFTVSDTNLDSCWYNTDYTGNTNIAGCTNTTISVPTGADHYLNIYTNDTAGNIKNDSVNFQLVYYNPTYNNETHEVVSEDFTLNLIYDSAYYTGLGVIFNYNGGEYSATKTGTGDNVTWTSTLTTPEVTGDENKTFYWTVSLSGGINYEFNTSTYTQLVEDVQFDDCSVYTNKIINMTLYDEDTKEIINISENPHIEIDLYIGETLQYHNEWENNTAIVCTNYDPTGVRADATILYKSDNRVVEYNYLDNHIFTNETLDIKLYDLLASESTTFLISFKDDYYLPVEGAIIDIWRYYVGDGQYRSVEMGETSEDGETDGHLIEEDIKYKFYVRKNGETIYISPEYNAFCKATPCQINLYQKAGVTTIGDVTEVENLDYSLDIDEDNREVSLEYSTLDGSPAEMLMTVVKYDNWMNETVCNQTQTSSGGTLKCLIPLSYSNATYYTKVTKDGSFVAYDIVDLSPSSTDIFGAGTGIILTVLMYLTLAMMGMANGIAVIAFGLIGIILATFLNIFSGGSILSAGGTVLWLIIAGIIIIIKISERRSG